MMYANLDITQAPTDQSTNRVGQSFLRKREFDKAASPACTSSFLNELPEETISHVLSRGEFVNLPSLKLLYRSRETPRHVHFLTSGVVSLITVLADGRTMEVGLVGCEGVPELFHLTSSHAITTEALIQVAGTAVRVAYPEVKRLVGENGPLRALLMDRIRRHGLISQQLAACAHFHEVTPRLARWLLMLQDRVGEPAFPITQEALATMIGVRRPTLTSTIGKLEEMKLIAHDRGVVSIVSRCGLEAVACECYAVVKELHPAGFDQFGNPMTWARKS